jgi:hypothetical protein
MNRKLLIVALCALFLVLFAQSTGLLAQEVTPEPTPDTPAITLTPEQFGALTNTGSTLLNVVFALITGGALGFATAIRGMNKQQIDNGERLYEALPPRWGTLFRDIVVSGKAAFDKLDQMTDGAPNEDTPQG